MAISSLYPTATNTATLVKSLTGGMSLPLNVAFFVVHNPNASASIAFTFDGTAPVINAAGITLQPLGTAMYPTDIACGGMQLISSVSSQTVTIQWK